MSLPPLHLQLPLELHEYIVDYLHDDRVALRACSLTSQSWLPVTRLHLFGCICLRRVPDCLRFLNALETSAFTHTRIADYVRDLRLPGMAFVSGNRGERKGQRLELVRHILRGLRNLTCLRVYAFEWMGFIDLLRAETGVGSLREALAAFFPFPDLRELLIDNLVLRSSQELTLLISLFPRLSRLDLQMIIQPMVPEDSRTEPSDEIEDLRHCVGALGTGIRTLVADFNTSSPAILGQIVGSLLLPPFEVSFSRITWDSCIIERRQIDDTSLLKEVLGRSETALESLKVQCPEDTWLVDLDLSRYHRLTTLTFVFRWEVDEPFFAALPTFVSGLPSGQLRDIHLHFEIDDTSDDWNYVDWPRLDQALASVHKGCPLLTITFHFYSIVMPAGRGKPDFIQPLKTRLVRTLTAGMRVGVVSSTMVIRPLDDDSIGPLEPLSMGFTIEPEEHHWL
ncbi:uncharacterized protein C8Q71DRAFT_758372 [Rhodofomes roseus]|uniref:F-box domain-containing protein n=1 Tax=Rhodofomes roseus TaxID=34475 RepID=A0ABQ8KFG8_9APHY|nr:uncharacterized protein C8Q71DRAFT_758372 [Rhodofomes roseus]KAH9836531.1 hypothetical protein C8Q71DRAFT_758372 [Rhodofomes roseus]